MLHLSVLVLLLSFGLHFLVPLAGLLLVFHSGYRTRRGKTFHPMGVQRLLPKSAE